MTERLGFNPNFAEDSASKRTAALASLKDTTAATLSPLLGDAYHDYLEGPGNWLGTLAPVPESKTQGNAQ